MCKLSACRIKVIKISLFLFCFQTALPAVSAEHQAGKKNWLPEVAEVRQDIQISKELIQEIKSKPPFVNIEKKKIWDFSDDKAHENNNADNEWISDLIALIAIAVEATLWLLPLLLGLYLYRYREYCFNLLKGNGLKPDHTQIPDTLFGLDIREKSLPENIEKAACELWQNNHYRDAVSLLYRASLANLYKLYKFDLSRGATEQDCMRQILTIENISAQLNCGENVTEETDADLQRIDYFKSLTDMWVGVAYAHQTPADEDFKTLCVGWNKLFAKSGGEI